MSVLSPETAFEIHAKGAKNLTRRMVVNIADDCMMTCKDVVLSLERDGLAKRGSWDWFKSNGGITRRQIERVRQDRWAVKTESP